MKTTKELLEGIEITTDPNYTMTLFPVPEVIKEQLEELYCLAEKGKKSSLRRFLHLVDKYPKIPILKNYLSVLYKNMGLDKKSDEINRLIIEKHPDYLFGKLNLASEYYYNEQYKEMTEVLGEEMDLKSLYPDRKKFHLKEVTGYYTMSVLYFCGINDIDNAETRVKILKELDEYGNDFKIANTELLKARMRIASKQILENSLDDIAVDVKPTIHSNKTETPSFIHAEILQLYQSDIGIDYSIIEKLKSLPRETLIKDLELVLADSIERFDYFFDKYDENIDENYTSFLIHAIFLLGDIEATESLENVLDILRQDNDFLNFYFGDILTDGLWMPIYRLANSQLDICKNFMFESGIYTYAKSEVAKVVEHLTFLEPDRKDEAENWFSDILNFYSSCSIEDNIIDGELIGLIISSILDINFKKALPIIETLYNKGYVDRGICGSLESVKKEFEKKHRPFIQKLISTNDYYTEILTTWSRSDIEEYENNEISAKHIQEAVNAPKIGRNDPCPCGSGKKYKKCCLNEGLYE
jgi:hypothetical protein